MPIVVGLLLAAGCHHRRPAAQPRQGDVDPPPGAAPYQADVPDGGRGDGTNDSTEPVIKPEPTDVRL